MSNPVIVVCTEDAWTLVAAGVTRGKIYQKNSHPRYLQTIRDAGGPAPDAADALEEGARMFRNGIDEVIEDDDPIDVYVYALGGEGLVRVDI